MLFKRLASAALATAVGIGAAGAAVAEDVTVSAEQLNALMERLEKAESKIQELESQKAAGISVPAAQLPQYEEPGTPSFLAPESLHRNASLSSAADADLMKRLESLESKWVELEESHSGVLDQLKDGFVQDGTSGATMKVSGRIHGDAWGFPNIDNDVNRLDRDGNPQDRLIWRRVRFGVKGKIKENMEYKVEMEFADPNDTQYRDVYIGFNDLPFFHTLLIGNQKRPLGLDHINSSRYNVFLERPFVVEAFNQDARRLGIASYGVSADQAWNWRWGFYNPELTQGDEGYTGDHWQGQLSGRLANTAWYDECTGGRSYIHWAIAGSSAWPDGNGGVGGNQARFDTRPEARTRDDWLDTGSIANTEHYQQLGLEGVVNLGPLQLVGEYESTWVNRGGGSEDVQLWGAYGYVSYFLTGEHIPWERKSGQLGRVKPFQNFFLVNTCDGCTESGWGAWQVAARYSYADFNDADVNGGIGSAFTLGVNWHWNPNARLQFNYIHGEITNSANRVVLNSMNTAPASGNYNVLGARFMVDF